MIEPNIDLLSEEFQPLVVELLENCKNKGHELRVFRAYSDSKEQTHLWRQSRTRMEVNKAAERLDREGAPWLTRLLLTAEPQYGRWATNNLPGQSWHQHGEAVKCYVVTERGKAAWSAKHPGYQVLAEEAKLLGLTPGLNWEYKNAYHVQLRSEAVRALYTWSEIDQKMRGA